MSLSRNENNITLPASSNINTSGNTYICYGKAKSSTWGAYQYTGTGEAGNFVETLDINGVARKPARVIIKSVSVVGDWFVFDNKRGSASTDREIIKLNTSDVETNGNGYIEILTAGLNIN
ncbi:MAG: hypothetical protein DRO11_08075, partial [Methanobacteriota archaeon]